MSAQTMTTQEMEQAYVVQTYSRAPFVLSHGEGVYLYDSDGKRYLDLVSGIAVNALGHGDPELVGAITTQTARLIHVSNLYHTEPQAKLARMLVERSFGDRVFFCNSGTESVEAAIKFARKWAHQRDASKTRIVAFENAFHGRTMGALALTPREHYQAPFRPLMPGASFATFNDLDSAAQALGDDVCACIVEPVQGEGGVNLADPGFLAGLRQLCDRHQALLIFDEVQCGLGRTGNLWAHELAAITPDIMTLAKPLGGGLPMGAVVMTEDVASAISPGDHGSTFAANPVVCAAAQVVLRRVSDAGFLGHVRAMGELFHAGLEALAARHEIVESVRGLGLIWGIPLKVDAGPLIEAGYQRGIITCRAGARVLRLLPPLTIDQAEVESALEALDDVFAQAG
jgi:acetylornithine/N-succinyldiaminopimelate aminotransferase